MSILLSIQEGYFDIIDNYFSDIYISKLKNQLTSHQVASNIANCSEHIEKVDKIIEPFLEELIYFWLNWHGTVSAEFENDNDSIKAVYGGRIFPSEGEDIASKYAIYMDTIILPCPFMIAKPFFYYEWNKHERVYFFVEFGLDLLYYKELSIGDFQKPIIAILSNQERLYENNRVEMVSLGENDSIYHAEKIFGRHFSNFDELLNFGKELNTVDKLMKEIKNTGKVLFDINNKDPLKKQIENATVGKSKKLRRTSNPGEIVSKLGLESFGICNTLLLKSLNVGGVPLIDSQTFWQYFKWKLRYDLERTKPDIDYEKLHIMKALTKINNTRLNWIGNIPHHGLIELRKSGAIDEIRSILGKGLNEIINADELDFRNTSYKVFNNLNFAFKQHQKNIQELTNKKWRVAGKDFGSWLAVGTLEITAACIGNPLYGVSSVLLNQVVDAPKIKDLPKSIDKLKKIEKEKDIVKKSPIGLMINYKT